ncbi:hypothetical protein BcepSauron_019 [Burkholderia phage BcepSauron]|uniref:Uncharacterized protein n=1 Tax=Burkholderia phage BcepSauron TaxID=2530033 RepID=A0A482ML72_9CAUD|nr:hypothetical protein H1O17_gp019 [Burkholderia phage BcepSauron]QBQ74399.1 hypothetical protein BcepSauron_019 [Burkholderia phage BcepSauron]
MPQANAIELFHAMKPYVAILERDGYTVASMQDGSIEVQDPVRVYNGAAVRTEYETVRLNTPRAVSRFIMDRS